jgi:hypothetical protein
VRAQGAEATLVLTGSDAPSAPFGCVSLAPTPSKRLTSLKTSERVLFFAKMSDGQVNVGQLTAP